MDPDGNRLQNSCSPRHWGHSTMHRVPPVSGTTTTIYKFFLYPKYHKSSKLTVSSVAYPGSERGVPWNPPFTQMLASKARTLTNSLYSC